MLPASPDSSGLHTPSGAFSDVLANFVCKSPSQSPDRSGSGLPLKDAISKGEVTYTSLYEYRDSDTSIDPPTLKGVISGGTAPRPPAREENPYRLCLQEDLNPTVLPGTQPFLEGR